MSLILDGIIDLQDKVYQRGVTSAQINDVVGILSQVRNYVLSDNDGSIGPFTSGGFLAVNPWRNRTIEDTNNGRQRVFTGNLQATGSTFGNQGYNVRLEAREPLGTLLQFVVEENQVFDQDPSFPQYSLWETGSAEPTRETRINVDQMGGSVEPIIPAPSLITFRDSLTPRYQIMQENGGATTNTVDIDRGLEQELSNGDRLKISIAVEKAPSQAIKDALLAAKVPSANLSPEFDAIAADDVANNRLIHMFIFIEDNITLASHIAKLLDLGDLFLSMSAEGVIGIRRGLAYAGEFIENTLTDDELMPDGAITNNVDKLVFAYNCLYIAESEAENATGQVDQTLINDFAPVNTWTPIEPTGRVVTGYKYIYNNATTADYFGQRRLDYYGSPKIRVTCPVKRSYHDDTLNPINIELTRSYRLTFRTSRSSFLISEPSAVLGYTFNDEIQRYDSVTFELTNRYQPNIADPKITPSDLVVVSTTENPLSLEVELEAFTGTLWADIFLADKKFRFETKIAEVTGTTATINSNFYNSGQTYFIQLYTKASGLTSGKTDFLRLTA